MKEEGAPALSVVLATAGQFASIRATFRHLQRQTIAQLLEIIILAPRTDDFGLEPTASADFYNVQLVPLGRVLPVADANAEGVRRASAPIVVFAEDHAFPDPEWAAALVARHREDWAAVGPVVRNANPQSAISWADYLMSYGPWHPHQPGGPAKMLPGHNSSYKRTVLLALGDDLASALRAESVLHETLRKRGERLYLENLARIAHLNFGHAAVFFRIQFLNGRQFGGCRGEVWPISRRALYAAAFPLIALVRFFRILRLGVRLPVCPSRLRIGLSLILGLFIDAAGQAVGYLCGTGSSGERLTQYEYDRTRFVRPRDLSFAFDR